MLCNTGVGSCSNGLSGQSAAVYFFDMIWAQTWAHMNRLTILSVIHSELQIPFHKECIIESKHNYIDFRDMIIRKGTSTISDILVFALILICRWLPLFIFCISLHDIA